MLRSFTFAVAFILASIAGKHSVAQATTNQPPTTAVNAIITVQITGARNTNGNIVLYLWNDSSGFPTKSEKSLKVTTLKASQLVDGAIKTTFSVAPGTYGISVLHDENNNGKMDSNAFGVPKEGYGVSNNPITHFHAPSFDQAKFQVPPRGETIAIALRY